MKNHLKEHKYLYLGFLFALKNLAFYLIDYSNPELTLFLGGILMGVILDDLVEGKL